MGLCQEFQLSHYGINQHEQLSAILMYTNKRPHPSLPPWPKNTYVWGASLCVSQGSMNAAGHPLLSSSALSHHCICHLYIFLTVASCSACGFRELDAAPKEERFVVNCASQVCFHRVLASCLIVFIKSAEKPLGL